MIQILYTDSDAILGVVGLTLDDISEDMFAARNIVTILSVDLYNWLPNHTSIFKPPYPIPSDQDKYNSDCLVLYCTYFCATKLIDAIFSIYASETDGQSEYTRFSSVKPEDLKRTCQSQAGYYRELLLAAIVSPTVATRVAQSTVPAPVYDPITG